MRFCLLFSLLLTAACAVAQPVLVGGDVCLDIEVVTLHTEGPLEGMTTYRLYVTLPGPQDVVTTVFGDANNPTALITSTSWYQDENGGQFPCANNPILFALYPELEHDSWLTLGIDGPPVPTDGEDCPQVVMSTGSPFITEFEGGESFIIDDNIGSAWFVVPTNTNGWPDEDGRVLLAQLTTDGELDGVLYLQILPGGVGALAQVVELPLYGPCDEIASDECPEEIVAVQLEGCQWGFEVSDFQSGEEAIWFFGDDVVEGGHYASYTFGGDGEYVVGVTFASDLCPQGVDLEAAIVVDGCTEVDCDLGLEASESPDGEGTVVTVTEFPEGVELLFVLNGILIQEGGTEILLPEWTGEEPWQLCVSGASETCPGVEECLESEGFVDPCPLDIFVEWSDPETGSAVLIAEGAPAGALVEWFDEEGQWLGEGDIVDLVEVGGTVCAIYETPDCPSGAQACVALPEFVSGCEVFASVTPGLECGQYTAAYAGEPSPEDLVWNLDGVAVQFGGAALDFEVDSAATVELCVVATGGECGLGQEWCTLVHHPGCAPCPDPAAGALTVQDGEAVETCFLAFHLELPDDQVVQSVLWDFGNGLTHMGNLFAEHQFANGGTYEVCATAYTLGCPDGFAWCTEVNVPDCETVCTPVQWTIDPMGETGQFNWYMYGSNWAMDGLLWWPEGDAEPVVQSFCLPDDCYVVDLWETNDGGGAANFSLALDSEDGTVDFYEGPFSDANGWQVFSFGVGETGCDPFTPEGCSLTIDAVQEGDGSWTLTAVTDAEEDLDFVWTLSDGSILNGFQINHFFATGASVETACVSATFWDCEEVLSACSDLEGTAPNFCEEVVISLDGETLESLLTGLQMEWGLLGDGFDLGGIMALDPEVAELGALVLCLPEGCYTITLGMQGVADFEGLPGMSLDLQVGEEVLANVDLAVVEDLIELEFGVMTECGTATADATDAVEGVQVFPNPVQGALNVWWPQPLSSDGLAWAVKDGSGRICAEGRTMKRRWSIGFGGMPAGVYLLEAIDGSHRHVQRVMVAH